MMRNLDITTLRSFVAVAELGGVTRAAGMLNLTQSAVSMQLKRLEDLLNTSLFDRSGRKIALTAGGEQLLGYARKMVDLNDEIVGRLTDEIYEGEISFGVPHDIVYPVVPRVLQRFNSAFPQVRVKLQSSSTVKLLQGYERGEIDLILTTESRAGAGAETLVELPLVWSGAKNGEAWKAKPLRLAFCSNCVFRPIVLRSLEAAGVDWDMAIETEDDRSVEALISADLAVSALLEPAIPSHQEQIDHGGALPNLGVQQVNLYGDTPTGSAIKRHLADMVRQGFGVPVATAKRDREYVSGF